jgi:RES domain-containing protein
MTVQSGLGWPPSDPAALQAIPPAAVPVSLHRLSYWPGVWWFATTGVEILGGRFDLAPPFGTCYLADELEGALIEKLLRTPKRIVSAEQLDRLFHVTVEVRRAPRSADLTATTLTGLGLNAEIHTSLDYAKPRAWAAALRLAGWRALRYAMRGDSALLQRGVALFGSAGLHRRAPAGMRASLAPLDRIHAASLLERRGVLVRPLPRAEDLPIFRPPEPSR